MLGRSKSVKNNSMTRNVMGSLYNLVISQVVPRGGSKKLYHPWTGPWKVIKQVSDAVYRIQGPSGSKQKRHVVHFDRLKPCAKGTEFIKPPLPSHGNRVPSDGNYGTSSHE